MSPKAERRAGELAQYACSMTGFAFYLWTLRGLSVVIFGERDCVNAFHRFPDTVAPHEGPWHFYTAAITEDDVTKGRMEERLLRCLRFVAGKGRPIVVLSTCLAHMVGADPRPVLRKVERETGVPIVYVATSGLRPKTQAEVGDWIATVLLEEFGERQVERDPTKVNLVGFQTHRGPNKGESFRAEVQRVLSRVGLSLNAAVPAGATLEEWKRLYEASLTVVADRACFRKFLSALGGEVVEMAPPVGIKKTDEFYKGIASLVGRSLDLEEIPERAKALKALEEARRKFEGKRLAYGLGSHHNFDSPQIVAEGLGDLPLLLELGFDIVVVIQERDRPEVHERIRKNLSALEVDLPYKLFYEPAVLSPVLEEVGADVAYISDFLGDQAERAKVPFVRLGRLRPGYGGVKAAIEVFGRALFGGFESRYRRFLC